jgi:hypothetical protein
MGTVFIISEATNSPSDYLNPGFPAAEVMGTFRFGSGYVGQWFLANVVLHSKELTLSECISLPNASRNFSSKSEVSHRM